MDGSTVPQPPPETTTPDDMPHGNVHSASRIDVAQAFSDAGAPRDADGADASRVDAGARDAALDRPGVLDAGPR